MELFEKIIKFVKAFISLQKADPEDKATIAALREELAQTRADLATSQANDPTPEQDAELQSLLDEAEALLPTEPPVE